MKIVIVYASAGSGHRKAAEAIYEYIRAQESNYELVLIDALEKSNFFFRRFYAGGYAFLVDELSGIWGLGFWLTSVKPLRGLILKIRSLINCFNSRGLLEFLIQEDPQVIIATHFLPADISAYLKQKRRINSRLITVITDFGVHPFWVSRYIDTYIVGSSLTKEKLKVQGIPEGKIRDSGIPVDKRFFIHFDKATLLKKYNLQPGALTVLIITGTFGIGPIAKIVKLLHSDIQLLVVCGKNRKLCRQLKQKQYPGVRVFGYIDFVHELMAVSSIIVTKPGGMSISELLAMEVAPVFISPIPGQETENARVLSTYGIGISASNPAEIRRIILEYKQNPTRLEEARILMRKIKKVSCQEDLLDVIRSGSCRVGS